MKKTLFLLAALLTSLIMLAQTVVDPNNTNSGTINPGIIFGNGSGEGIASKRTGGGNQYGLDFYSNFTNRMVITNGGFVGIGTTTPSKQLSVATGMNIDQVNENRGNVFVNALTFGNGNAEGIASCRLDGNPNVRGLDLYTAGVSRLSITNNGYVGIGISNPSVKLQVTGAIMSSAGIVPSDIRFKKNITPIHHALKTIMALSGFTYNLKAEEFPEMNFDSKLQYGLLAQKVEKVIPEIVYTLNNGYKALDYTRIIPFLVEGMKEQQQLIEKQQQQIDELKKMVTALLKQ